ncbi:MAG: RnfABCDGE type electron transport complex subunit C [Bacilli bacterium]
MIAKTRAIKDIYNLTRALPTRNFVNPKYVYIATNNARCNKSEMYVKPGDYVKCCQIIGKRDGGFFEQNIYSTVSGTVLGYEKHYHRSGKEIEYLKIENDYKDDMADTIFERTEEEISKLTKEDMMKIIRDTALVGLGGSSFPTYVKFQTKEKIDTILINGIECEPYLTTDHRIMLEYTHEIIAGIKYAMQAFGAKKAVICFKKKYDDLEELWKAVLKVYPNDNISYCKVGNFYPQGWEIEMIKSATGIDIPHGVLPAKYGIMNFNVSTCLGIWRAIKHNEPVIERNITITGDGIVLPQNFRVRGGTSFRDLLPLVGGYTPGEKKLFIMGGPMMGVTPATDDVILTRTVTSIIILNEHEYKEEPCVRCGSCVYSCPIGLLPVQIMNAVKAMDKERMVALKVNNCIECGLCTYSCTSKIHVTDYVRRAKLLTKAMKK